MRRSWRLLAAAAVALAACEQPAAPGADDAARCMSGDAAACSAVVEDQTAPAELRSAAYAQRGELRLAEDDVTPALRDFAAALELDGDNPAALLGRARILVESGQLDAAEPLLRRSIDLHGSGAAHELLGQVELRRGAFERAVEHFDAALAVDQRAAVALAGRARAKQRLADLDGARADYDAAIRANGALADARGGRCWLNLRQERDLEQARNDAEAGAAADPRHVEAQLCRGVLQLRGGEWANARASFEAVLAVEAGNPVALFGRGVARRRSGDGAGREDMNLARDFDSHIGQAFDDWGVETY